VGSLATRPQHPLVTIFAAAGLPARPIAEKVAERLRVPILDLGGNVEQLTATLEKALSSEDRSRTALSDLLSRLGAASDSDDKSAFRTQLREAVLRLGSRTGGVVVSPVAAVVLSDQPGGLHVRLVAPLERRLAGARQEGESEDDARRRLEEIDREREASVKDTYGLDLNDPRLYQLTLDPTVFPLESCVDLIATAAESAVHEGVARPAPAVTAPSPAG
jgi:cytidylate kinase